MKKTTLIVIPLLVILLLSASGALAALDQSGNPYAVRGNLTAGGSPQSKGYLGFWDNVIKDYYYGLYGIGQDSTYLGIGAYVEGSKAGIRARLTDISKMTPYNNLSMFAPYYYVDEKGMPWHYGVYAIAKLTGKKAIGVYADGGDFGVYGKSDSIGIQGEGQTGVRGKGSTYGVYSEGPAYVTDTLETGKTITTAGDVVLTGADKKVVTKKIQSTGSLIIESDGDVTIILT